MAVEIVSWKKYSKNTLRGFLTIRLTNVGLEIRDMTLHQKNNSRWMSLPAKPYKKEDGTQAWNHIVKFYDEARGKQFQKAVLEALDNYGNE